jgi:hypothetical protein
MFWIGPSAERTAAADSASANSVNDSSHFFEKIATAVSIAAWPVRLMSESLAAVQAKQIQ